MEGGSTGIVEITSSDGKPADDATSEVGTLSTIHTTAPTIEVGPQSNR